MKKILLISLSLFFIACEIEYDGETKLVIKGKVFLENNLPLADHEVKLYVLREASSIPFIFYVPSETNFIGKATTDSTGEYTMVIPKPTSNYNEIIIEINSDSSYNSQQIRNIDSSDFIDFELSLATAKLYLQENLSQLFINLNQVNPNFQFIKINYIGEFTNEISYFKPIENEYNNYFYDLSPLVLKNQALTIQWEVKNMNTNNILTFEEVLIINDQNTVQHTLNY